MSVSDVFIGVTLSETRLVVAALPEERVWKVSNEEWGLTELVKRLAALRPKVVVIQSARGKERPVQRLLEEAGLSAVIVSQSRIKDFVDGQDLSVSPDAHAMALALYGRSAAFEVSRGKNTASELESLLMRRCQLMEMLAAEKDRRETSSKRVRFDVEAHISWLEKCLKAINDDTTGFIKKLPIWSQQKKPIKIVPGAGPVWIIPLLTGLIHWAPPGTM